LLSFSYAFYYFFFDRTLRDQFNVKTFSIGISETPYQPTSFEGGIVLDYDDIFKSSSSASGSANTAAKNTFGSFGFPVKGSLPFVSFGYMSLLVEVNPAYLLFFFGCILLCSGRLILRGVMPTLLRNGCPSLRMDQFPCPRLRRKGSRRLLRFGIGFLNEVRNCDGRDCFYSSNMKLKKNGLFGKT
jgi:hypothetical protein